jgi:hypothetical protein
MSSRWRDCRLRADLPEYAARCLTAELLQAGSSATVTAPFHRDYAGCCATPVQGQSFRLIRWEFEVLGSRGRKYLKRNSACTGSETRPLWRLGWAAPPAGSYRLPPEPGDYRGGSAVQLVVVCSPSEAAICVIC